MTVTVSSFRTDFPEFASLVTYPDTQVAFWLGLAGKLHSADRWGDLLDYGVELFMAHNLSIAARDTKAAATSGVGGGASGLISAKSVDKVSASYDTGAVTIAGAGQWNLTTYGTRYVQLASMIGAGGVQL